MHDFCEGCPLTPTECLTIQHPCWRDPRWQEFGYDEIELARAALNRELVEGEYATTWWKALENSIRGVGLGKIPRDVPIGELPQVGHQPRARYFEEDLLDMIIESG